jgi:multidrug resistance efflux pump
MPRLERALWQLERTVHGARHPVRRLRSAIEKAKTKGEYNENRLLERLHELEARTSISVEDIDHLARKIEKEGLP